MFKKTLLLALLLIATPTLASAAPSPVPTVALEDANAFLACAQYHIGLAMSTGNPVHFLAAAFCTPLILR